MAANSKIILITGANTGLGLEIVKSLLQSSHAYTILLGGRSIDKAQNAAAEAQKQFPSKISTIKPVQIDISDDASINRLFEHVSQEYGHLDVLLNNAGTQIDQQLAAGKISVREMWNETWNVNTTSTWIITYTFMPLLLKSSDPRLIFVTSGVSTLAESENTAVRVNTPAPAGWPKEMLGVPAYRAAKTGLNMMMREWVRLLKNDGVKTWCVSPGFLATGLGIGNADQMKKMGAIDPTIGANFMRSVVEGERDEHVGKVIRKDDVQPF